MAENQNQHTPGPWRSGDSHVRTDNGVFCVIAQTYTGCDVGRFEAAANARLIAAAPNLLAAAQLALAFVYDTADKDEKPEHWTITKAIETAIAKATGAA